MDGGRFARLVYEPSSPWAEEDPYRILEAALSHGQEHGLLSEASMSEVQDLLFELMETGRVEPRVRKAWDALRSVRGRLLHDFLRYEPPHPDVSGVLEEFPMPVFRPDFRELLRDEHDLERSTRSGVLSSRSTGLPAAGSGSVGTSILGWMSCDPLRFFEQEGQ